ncbi:hypothetical protein [Phreatobacter oligotrophus]|jgi:ElaB/YqjD/DUF883 family membrane-anchored ribosome-binding protein|uniref:hypothetical protein n=1 Tax=Phreatobacter oligotrophus TaxID=1122261 RepID=UPI002356F9B4|nr:hypothetical protein [Phreatobacter oligotrophus]MBX9992302.1 hypothetical protein [Phreatobacter oligotrophus]
MADANTMNPQTGVSDLASAASSQLKAVGVDTDVMANRAGDLQRMLRDEITSRPFQSIALAAFVGFLYGMRR